MTRFAPLLRREWMQHHRGYLALAVIPPVLLLLVLTLGPDVQIQPALSNAPMVLMPLAIILVTVLVAALTWLGMAFQLPGLARRDQQDRSIEFWLSLPVSHGASVGATLLFHAILVPLAALVIGWAFSHVLGLVMVAMVSGAATWSTLPWGLLLPDALVLLLRMALGLTLATLWVSPLLMVLMLASAGLKRWGVPAVIAGTVGTGLVLHHGFGITGIADTLAQLMQQAAFALSPWGASERHLHVGENGADLLQVLQVFPSVAGRSAIDALQALASPLFVAAMAVSAACFYGLVLLRQRNG